MPYFRVTYQGYLEDEFDTADEALDKFIEILHDTDAEDHRIEIEEWNGEEWL